MMVNGPLEIYGAVIGTHLFDAMFNILASTGIAFIPYLTLFFHNITQPYESEIANGADTSLRRVVIHFFIMSFFIMLFTAPTHRLDVKAISYTPVCTTTAVPSTFGDTGTTYDTVFSDLQYDDIRLPIGLTAVLSVASGITNAMIVSLPCITDVQQMKSVIDTTRLTPQLTQEVNRFETECYATAKAKFMNTNPDPGTYANTMEQYGGQSDLSWVGSHVLQSLYYDQVYPTNPVPSFPYSAYPYRYQDYNAKAEKNIPQTKGGYPSCLAWWTDAKYGLEGRLLNLVNEHDPKNPHLGYIPTYDKMKSWLAKIKNAGHVGSQVTPEDVIVRSLLYDVNSDGGFGRNFTSPMDDSIHKFSWTGFISPFPNASQLSAAANVAAVAGQGVRRLFSSINRAEIKQEIPILQAILMALVLSLGPLILVLGGYRIKVVFPYYFILSSIISITYVERLINYLELSFHASQSYGMGAVANVWIMYNVFTKLYFYAPVLYLALMTICGITAGSALNSAFGDSVAGAGSALAKKLGGSVGMVTKFFGGA